MPPSWTHIDAPVASTGKTHPPRWATLQRQLFELLEAATRTYLEKYTLADGSLRFRDDYRGRDGADDLYESFYPLPFLYTLGGNDQLLTAAHHHWEGTTRQLAALGFVVDEFERGYDWFHQGEGQLLFYGLCLADPQNASVRSRARRFADLYVSGRNYDPRRNMILAPHNGSAGPRPGYMDEDVYAWSEGMARYGLPLEGIEGVRTYDDLRVARLAERMGREINRRARGDVAVNLATLALAATAYTLRGERDLAEWITRYADGWMLRARNNEGMLPDNVGPSGMVGEDFEGRWFGASYGWTWPHGLLSVGTAAGILATVVRLVTGRDDASDPLRVILDAVEAEGRITSRSADDDTLMEEFVLPFSRTDSELLVVPHRRGREGWFDFQPMLMALPTALWSSSLAHGDWQRLRRLRDREPTDWQVVLPFRTKEDNGHERPWLAFLDGDNPDYPERIMEASIAVVRERLQVLLADTADTTSVHIHHWQNHNPVTLEGLFQLTLGAPSPLYNGGLLIAPLRHFDIARRRPGLPPDVAALVAAMSTERVTIELVNVSPRHGREVGVQAGAFGEHKFTHAVVTDPDGATRRVVIEGSCLAVRLSPGSQTRIELGWQRYVNAPTALPPWARMQPPGDKR